ncbi:MAG: DNA-3-methyladenine glycosylase 2 family protein [Tenericutes bacterium HGW-Tenericutes-8]|nr:MAG: DNA-3-methyladenine glycosylase 2 family protein [Tenericutes bacterium HGW-Tenericutes-8]PKK96366.1 MAG: DNA-3-methyladenine glycosylase 2 family protein [Tenericutes bacterium HGW-Tenericutes-3]
MKRINYRNDSKEVQYLINKDQRLKELFAKKAEIIVTIDDDYFVSLVGTIVAQQLSSKVARTIYSRLSNLFDGNMNAEKILATRDEDLRSIGLSFQKIKYVKSLATCYLDQTIDLAHLDEMSDDQIIQMLIKIKGIGIWSAQMFLLFSLGREDVFSVLDLGLRNAVKLIYGNPDLTHQDIELLSEKWIPYRSIVSHYLWHAWDNE